MVSIRSGWLFELLTELTIGQTPFSNKTYEITQKMNKYLESFKIALHMCYLPAGLAFRFPSKSNYIFFFRESYPYRHLVLNE